jgi:hypothetical protein
MFFFYLQAKKQLKDNETLLKKQEERKSEVAIKDRTHKQEIYSKLRGQEREKKNIEFERKDKLICEEKSTEIALQSLVWHKQNALEGWATFPFSLQ